MIENLLGIPRLPGNLDLLVPGEVYLVPEDAGVQVLLRHCAGLNCSHNTSDGTINFGVINHNTNTSTPFTARPGTQLRVIYPTDASCRCGQCNRHCVTLGPHNSDNIYNVQIQSKTPEDSRRYVGHIAQIPVGSKIRTVNIVFGEVLCDEESCPVKYKLEAGMDCVVGRTNRGHTVQVLHDISYFNGKRFLLPDKTVVEILERPDISKIWTTCWELKDHQRARIKFTQSLRSFGDRLLSNLRF